MPLRRAMPDYTGGMDLSPTENTTISIIWKRVVSCALLVYLFVLILGPLSNPIGSEHLVRPLAKRVAPIHRAMFLGHGYRFFAPNPGPSHLVEFQITKEDGSTVTGRFPDRDDVTNSFPRLQYHRWFMLSETIWAEHLTPSEADIRAAHNRLERIATEKQIAGHHKSASHLRAGIKEQKESYANTRERSDELFNSVARNLLQMHGGESIKLFVRERQIPFPIDVREGVKLGDESFFKLKVPSMIGQFEKSDFVDVAHDSGDSQ